MTTQALRFELYDCLALFFLAASCASRGRVAGESPVGCLLVGFFAAYVWPLGRELLFHGSPTLVFSSVTLQCSLLVGVVAGTLYTVTLEYFERLVVWTELIALALVTTFSLFVALPRMSASGALLSSLFLAGLPFIVCDVMLGDVARCVNRSYLFMRAFLGAVLACAACVFLPPFALPVPTDTIALCIGVLVPAVLQLLRPKLHVS